MTKTIMIVDDSARRGQLANIVLSDGLDMS